MSKVELKFSDVQGHVLSPGDIFLKQKTGNLVLISEKSDFLNIELIEKLFKANKELLIENPIDFELQENFKSLFENHKAQDLVREKLVYRKKILLLFENRFASPDFTQDELNYLVWRVFSNIDREKIKFYLNEDIELFKRSMSIAANYTLCAFVLGYYNDEFLTSLYNNTFYHLMDLNKDFQIMSIKSQLEKMRVEELWLEEDKDFLRKVYSFSSSKDFIIGERYDGLGLKKYHKNEMSDLELVFIALNSHYSYLGSEGKSLFFDIKNKHFRCDEKVLNSIEKSISVAIDKGESLISLVG